MQPLPTTLDYESVFALGNAARLIATGKVDQLDKRLTFNAAWDVSGYAGGVLLKEKQATPGVSVEGKFNPDTFGNVDMNQVASECDKLCGMECIYGDDTNSTAPGNPPARAKNLPKGAVPADMKGVDWKKLLQGALKILALIGPLLV